MVTGGTGGALVVVGFNASRNPNAQTLRDFETPTSSLGYVFCHWMWGGCRVEAYLKTAALSEKDAGGGLPALNVAISAHAVASFGVGLGMLP